MALNATQGHKLIYQQAITLALNATQGHKLSYQQAITSALNATQGHKRSYQQAITLALNVTQGHKYWLLIDLSPILHEVSSQPKYSTGVKLLYNTVIKAEF